MKNENTPIMVANEEWKLPENLINEIKSERMINGLIDMVKPNVLKKEDLVGWAECIGYLMPATKKGILAENGTTIYLYCLGKLLERMKIKKPDFLKGYDKLSYYQLKELKRFKMWIYDNRGGKEKNPILQSLSEVFKENN